MHKLLFLPLLLPFLLFAQESGSDIKGEAKYEPGDHELMLMPTAYTMEKGQMYFEDYELFFINFVYAPLDGTHLGAFTLFPITSDFLESLSLGAKQRLYGSEKFSLAAWGSYFIKSEFVMTGLAVSVGKKSMSFHGGFGYGKGDGDGGGFYNLGFRGDISKKFSFIAEYANSTDSIVSDFAGTAIIGIRFRSGDVAWDLGGIRFLDIPSSSDLLFLPLLKATVVF